jgi:hypothetical protein
VRSRRSECNRGNRDKSSQVFVPDRLLGQKLDAKTKQPFAIAMKDGKPYAFAGLWKKWKDRKVGIGLLTLT